MGLEVFPSGTKKIHHRYKSTGNKNLKLSKNVESINFSGGKGTNFSKQFKTFKHLNKNLTCLEANALEDCSIPIELDFGKSKISIFGENAIKNCENLSCVYLPPQINTIPNGCFEDCKNLKKVTFHSFESDDARFCSNINLKKISNNAFKSCKNLKLFCLPSKISNLTCLENDSFSDSGLSGISFVNSTVPFSESDLNKNLNSTKYISLNTTTDSLNTKIYSRTHEEFLNPNIIYKFSQGRAEYLLENHYPFIIIYLDSKTSIQSRVFLEEIFLTDSFLNNPCGDNLTFFWLLEDREGYFYQNDLDCDVSSNSDLIINDPENCPEDLKYYRELFKKKLFFLKYKFYPILDDNKRYIQTYKDFVNNGEFPILNFIWNTEDKFIFDSMNLSYPIKNKEDILQKIYNKANTLRFNEFSITPENPDNPEIPLPLKLYLESPGLTASLTGISTYVTVPPHWWSD